jgi:hypothetical protein
MVHRRAGSANQFSQWVRRHGREVSLISVVLVILSFVVKDLFRDNLKDVDGAINAAEDVHLIAVSLDKTNDRIDTFALWANDVYARVVLHKTPLGAGGGDRYQTKLALSERSLARIRTELTHVKILTSRISGQQAHDAMVDENVKRGQQLESEVDRARLLFYQGALTPKPFEEPEVEVKVSKFEAEVGTLVVDVEHDVASLRKRKESQLRVANWATFIIGGIAVLLGALPGRPEMNGGVS